ncbi:hypothetical protein WSK_2072 [Novosphingobium sp. Rr 2-17]|uniref:hypothetical protein n=1 Tax=Novosphingobium sp. Rr 2-17 TaxID=555793 RepID=UPI0002698892|nr:hypothetical protein [Novosphingobium sp. Rr 2-17]EIZ79227.1 hypothetical protein WSK_2072 [Novosphingobium sp. Rr 2-17]
MAITNTTILDLVPSEKRLANRVDARIAATFPLLASGVAVASQGTADVLSGGGRKQSVSYINPLAGDEPNVGTDDITVPGNVGKMTAGEFNVLRHDLNQGWGTAALATMITQYDAAGGISAGIASYWNGAFEKVITSSIVGAAKATSLAALTYGDGTALLSYDLVNAACLTAGMFATSFDTLFVSPAQYALLQKDKVNGGFSQKGDVDPNFATWNGFKLIRTAAFGDTTMVAARPGAVLFQSGSPVGSTSFEVERLANGAGGQGGDILHSRYSVVGQINGVDYKGATGVARSALEVGTNWQAAIPVAEVGVRLIKCKLA